MIAADRIVCNQTKEITYTASRDYIRLAAITYQTFGLNKQPKLRFNLGCLWWAEVDSNHRSRRRQIYSLIHLAALESAHIKFWSR